MEFSEIKSLKYNRDTKEVFVNGESIGKCHHSLSKSTGFFAESGHNVGTIAHFANLTKCKKISDEPEVVEYTA